MAEARQIESLKQEKAKQRNWETAETGDTKEDRRWWSELTAEVTLGWVPPLPLVQHASDTATGTTEGKPFE